MEVPTVYMHAFTQATNTMTVLMDDKNAFTDLS